MRTAAKRKLSLLVVGFSVGTRTSLRPLRNSIELKNKNRILLLLDKGLDPNITVKKVLPAKDEEDLTEEENEDIDSEDESEEDKEDEEEEVEEEEEDEDEKDEDEKGVPSDKLFSR